MICCASTIFKSEKDNLVTGLVNVSKKGRFFWHNRLVHAHMRGNNEWEAKLWLSAIEFIRDNNYSHRLYLNPCSQNTFTSAVEECILGLYCQIVVLNASQQPCTKSSQRYNALSRNACIVTGSHSGACSLLYPGLCAWRMLCLKLATSRTNLVAVSIPMAWGSPGYLDSCSYMHSMLSLSIKVQKYWR